MTIVHTTQTATTQLKTLVTAPIRRSLATIERPGSTRLLRRGELIYETIESVEAEQMLFFVEKDRAHNIVRIHDPWGVMAEFTTYELAGALRGASFNAPALQPIFTPYGIYGEDLLLREVQALTGLRYAHSLRSECIKECARLCGLAGIDPHEVFAPWE